MSGPSKNLPLPPSKGEVGRVNEMADVLEHVAIIEDQPRGSRVCDEFRGKKGVKLVEHDGGKFELDLIDTKRKQEFREMTDPARRRRAERASKMNAEQATVEVKDRGGHRKRVRAGNERELVRTGAIQAARSYSKVRIIKDARGYLWREVGKGNWEPTHKKQVGQMVEPEANCQCLACVPHVVPDDNRIERVVNE